MITMEVTTRYIGAEGHRRKGDIVVVDESRARQLILNGVAKVRAGPAEIKPAGPQENKVKKSSGAPKVGRSTPTLSSSAPGVVQRLSVSLAGPASRVINAITSGINKAKAKFGLLQ